MEEIWDLIESVSEGFPTFFFAVKTHGIRYCVKVYERPDKIPLVY